MKLDRAHDEGFNRGIQRAAEKLPKPQGQPMTKWGTLGTIRQFARGWNACLEQARESIRKLAIEAAKKKV